MTMRSPLLGEPTVTRHSKDLEDWWAAPQPRVAGLEKLDVPFDVNVLCALIKHVGPAASPAFVTGG
jgi:hypothetical protein